jgi:hypothetical protein
MRDVRAAIPLLASGQIAMRKGDGWQSLLEKPCDQIIDLTFKGSATLASIERPKSVAESHSRCHLQGRNRSRDRNQSAA